MEPPETLDNKVFNYSAATISALVMGSIVYSINSDHGVEPALIAATKQSIYTALAAYYLTRLSDNIAKYSKKASWILPSILTIGLTYVVHSIKGTPEPVESTLPTVLLGPPGFAMYTYKEKIVSLYKKLKRN